MKQAPPYAPPPVRPPWNGKTNGFSIAALVLSILGCTALVGVALGVVGLVQSRRNGDRRGRTMAVVALCIAGVWTAIPIAVYGYAVVHTLVAGPDRDENGVVRGERSIAVEDLRTGDCVKDLRSGLYSRVDVAPCTTPHSSEVFATFPSSGPTAEDAAEGECRKRFEAYGGTKEPPRPLTVYWLTLESPDDLTLCFAHQIGGSEKTGTLRR